MRRRRAKQALGHAPDGSKAAIVARRLIAERRQGEALATTMLEKRDLVGIKRAPAALVAVMAAALALGGAPHREA